MLEAMFAHFKLIKLTDLENGEGAKDIIYKSDTELEKLRKELEA